MKNWTAQKQISMCIRKVLIRTLSFAYNTIRHNKCMSSWAHMFMRRAAKFSHFTALRINPDALDDTFPHIVTINVT